MPHKGMKITHKSQGKIAVSSFGITRKLDIEYNQFEQWFKNLSPKKEHCWPIGIQLPPILEDLSEQLRSLFELKTEITAFGFRILSPADKNDFNQQITINHLDPQTSNNIGARIFITLGSLENLSLFAQGEGKTGQSETLLFKDSAFFVPIGVSSGLDVTINNKNYVKSDSKKGFRNLNFKKDPSKRIFIIVDCGTNIDILSQIIGNEAKKASEGDINKEQQLNNIILGDLGLSQVDQVASKAANQKITIVEGTRESLTSDVDQIVNRTLVH